MLKKEQNRVWTIPNILSFIRLVLIIPTAHLLWKGENISAVILAIIGGILDISDGIVARKFNQKSELGKILDPLADKLFIAVLVIVLLLQNKIHIWFVIVVLARDFLILIGGAIISSKIKVIPPSNWLGKITALLIGITIITIILDLKQIITILMIISVILIVSSFINYTITVYNQIKEKQIGNK